jgi:hypothetical protein
MFPMKPTLYIFFGLFTICTACDEMGSQNDAASGLSGKAGSMARFGMTSTHLYSVDNASLNIYRIAANGALEDIKAKVELGAGIETIFPYGDKLFIGTAMSMMIYDITSPEQPTLLSIYSHVTGCDPVVVQDTLAYVTLRTTGCRTGGGTNVLDIINIKDPTKPVVVKSIQQPLPYGLGVDGNSLFVCQGRAGLNIYDITKRADPVLAKRYEGIYAFDVIPHNGTLIMTGVDGIVQYDYKNGPNDVRLLSTIPVEK